MDIIPAARICSSGLLAERTRMEAAAHNLANAHATRGADGEVFRRAQVILETDRPRAGSQAGLPGVRVVGVTQDPRPPQTIYNPQHPDADSNGMVATPRVTPMEELLDMITASRSYEANLSVMKQSRAMAERTIDMLRGSKG